MSFHFFFFLKEKDANKTSIAPSPSAALPNQ